MAFQRDDIQTILDRVRGDMRSALGVQTILRRSFLGAIARALSGLSHMLHGHIFWLSKQIFADTSEDEYLERQCAVYGISKISPTFAKLSLEATGTNGTVVPAGTVLQRDDGLQFTSTDDATISGGSATLEVEANEAGASYNTDAGNVLTLVSPIAGIENEMEVLAITMEGEDEETNDSLRERLLARIQTPPSGGAAFDYVTYAREVAGVTRAWVFPGHLGEGTVGVSFVEDNDVDPIPDNAKTQEVQSYIEERAPVEADVYVFAPTRKTVDMTIKISPNTVAVQNAIRAEIEDMFNRLAQVAGSWGGVGITNAGKIELSKINEAISIADGEEDHAVVTPTADIVPATGEIALLGTITWQAL
jgi:uncharacterized phage protein gp47/JayE